MAAAPVIEFRTGIRDKISYAVRWLGVAVQRGSRVRVLADAQDLPVLSHALWTTQKEGFLPHVICEPGQAAAGGAVPAEAVWSRTPIWLGSGSIGLPEPELLLNIGATLPADVSSCARVIEVVSTSDAEIQSGRERWAGYRRWGLVPLHRAPGDRTTGDAGHSREP